MPDHEQALHYLVAGAGMSVAHEEAVWQRRELRGPRLLVALVIARRAHSNGVAQLGVDFIAHEARLSPRTVQRCLRDLCHSGHLVPIHEPTRGGKHRKGRYRVLDVPHGTVTEGAQ